MNILTPWKLAKAADMVHHVYLPEYEFEPKSSGVVLCYLVQLKKALSRLSRKGKYIVVVRDGMQRFTEEIVEGNKYVKYWFSTNCMTDHERTEGMPSGLFISGKCRTEEALRRMRIANAEPRMIENEIMLCYPDNTEDRVEASYALYGKPYATRFGKLEQIDFYRAMRAHRFVASPWGAEPDCNRTWEALYAGAYPIVKHCTAYDHFQDMPIAFVNEWIEINEAWLDRWAKICAGKSTKRLSAEYWVKRIRDKANELL